jgi:pimeloyl-ACP methyl ester carboxylesterase
MLAAQALVPRVSGLVLFGFAYDPASRFARVDVPDKPVFAKNTRAAANSDFISPRVTPAAVVTAFAAQALRADPVLVDLKGDDEFNGLDPSRITMPALILYGADDPGVTADAAEVMGASLAASDVQIVALPGADHAAQLEDTHDQWVSAVVSFVTRAASRKQP